MKKLQEIDLLVDEALTKLQKHFTVSNKQILTDLARKCAEINVEDIFHGSIDVKNFIDFYNSSLRDGQVEEVKQELKEQTKPPSSKYYPLFKYFLDQHNVMLLETDCQEIERLLNTQQSNLQPLPIPEKLSNELAILWGKDIEMIRNGVAQYLYSNYGTQPREWWMDLKKGDKFRYYDLMGYEVLKTFSGKYSCIDGGYFLYTIEESDNIGLDATHCSPYTDPTQSFRSKLTPEMQVEFDKLMEGK